MAGGEREAQFIFTATPGLPGRLLVRASSGLLLWLLPRQRSRAELLLVGFGHGTTDGFLLLVRLVLCPAPRIRPLVKLRFRLSNNDESNLLSQYLISNTQFCIADLTKAPTCSARPSRRDRQAQPIPRTGRRPSPVSRPTARSTLSRVAGEGPSRPRARPRRPRRSLRPAARCHRRRRPRRRGCRCGTAAPRPGP